MLQELVVPPFPNPSMNLLEWILESAHAALEMAGWPWYVSAYLGTPLYLPPSQAPGCPLYY
jgi:hypothetical protein